jgi:hypothetical protein
MATIIIIAIMITNKHAKGSIAKRPRKTNPAEPLALFFAATKIKRINHHE